MKAFIHIFLYGLLVLLLAGCSAEDGDLTPPDATIDTGVQSPTTSISVVLTGTMAADALITADSNTTNDLIVTQDNILGTWSCAVDNMIEGSNIILISATDPVGNTRLMSVTIVVDTTGPVTTILQYPEIAQAGSFNFAGTVDEAGSTVSVEVFVSGGGTTGLIGAASVDANIWDVDMNLSALADGDYTIFATGTDRLGNDSTTPAEQLITLNLQSPAFAITSPLALPVVLNTDIDQQVFVGTTTPLSILTVTPSTTVTPPDAFGDWDSTVSGIVGGNTVVTFDVVDGVTTTVQRFLIVRDQTAPNVVEWLSPNNTTITIEFNELMNAATILTENLLVIDANETAINVSGVTTVDNWTFIFTLDALPPGNYSATLQVPLQGDCTIVDGCTVEDARGNGIASSYIWRLNY